MIVPQDLWWWRSRCLIIKNRPEKACVNGFSFISSVVSTNPETTKKPISGSRSFGVPRAAVASASPRQVKSGKIRKVTVTVAEIPTARDPSPESKPLAEKE